MAERCMLAKFWVDYAHKFKEDDELIAQPKLDGVRLIWDGGRALSRTGKELFVPPAVLADLRTNFEGVPLDGELYLHGLRFDEISGIVRRLKARRLSQPIEYHVFDMVAEGQCDERLATLASMDGWTGNVQLVSHQTIAAGSVPHALKMCVAAGYEGVMLRNPKASYQLKRTRDLLKYKHWIYALAHIIRMEEGTGKCAGMLGSVLLAGVDGWVCDVGSGFTDVQRMEMWARQDELLDQLCTIKYQELTKKGSLRFPIWVGLGDLIAKAQETDG
jgi:DNA ligase 1